MDQVSPKKLTKIIATIGPASDSEEMIEKLINAGVNVFRFNFKHGTVEWHDERIQRVNQVAQRLQVPIGTLLDLQGPELRLRMKEDSMELTDGEEILLDPTDLTSSEKAITITHPNIISELHQGQVMIADDGKFRFEVTQRDGKVYLRSQTTGKLGNRKTLNIPGADFTFPVLIDRDYEGLKMAERLNIDYVALSFVRSESDMDTIRDEMNKLNVKSLLVAKIETEKSLHELPGIVNKSDAIMVARGDLGVELPLEQVPYYTRQIIMECLIKGKPVITATQMIETMMENPYPTRAEVSDIANATYSLTDAVMLSGETASGKYPHLAVSAMAKTVMYNELRIEGDTRNHVKFEIKDQTDMICDAAYNLLLSTQRKGNQIGGFIIFTHSGNTARRLAMFRPRIPVFAICPNQIAVEKLTLNFGVHPILHPQIEDTSVAVTYEHIKGILEILCQSKTIEAGKQYIVLFGDYWAVQGGSSTLKIVSM